MKIFHNPYLLAVLSSVLLRLSFPKFNLWMVAWVAFVPLFFALRAQRLSKVFLLSLFSGFIYYVFLVFWLINVTVAGMLVLSAYLAVYIAVFGSAYSLAKDRLNFWQRLFFIPSAWVLLEFARGVLLTGFPWALVGYSQSYNIAAIQAADIFGAYGVSFIIVFANVFACEALEAGIAKKPLPFKSLLIPSLIIIAWFSYGVFRVLEDPKRSCPLKVALVQGNIPQEIKWVQAFRNNILKKYELLTDIAHLKEEPDIVIWPETSFPDYLEYGENDKPLKDFAAQAGSPLLVGSIRLEGLRYYNSTLLFSSDGKLITVYDKMHLVPFGEYLPLRNRLPFLERIVPIEDFTPGRDFTIFSVKGRHCPALKFATLICFEDILGDLAAGFVRRGADFLVNMTNDAWFGDTASTYQHMQASVLRAVENRVFVVRAANTGISCIIDDTGRIIKTASDSRGKETFTTSYVSGMVFKSVRKSAYTRIGDIFSIACCMYVSVLAALLLRRKRTGKA